MTAHRERASLLMQQGKLDLAVEEFERALLEDPQDAVAHGCLALCFCELKRLDEAERSAVQAVRHAPDSDFGHYALASIHFERNRFPEAHREAAEALRLGPDDAHNFALMAQVLLAQQRWKDASEAAEAGLRIDPQHVQCLNLRALALQQLGRPDDAHEVLAAALARDPESASTHTTAGWAELRRGDAEKALEHFRQALRKEPTLDHAREGIVEALKARNPLYAWLLRYFFWMSRLSRRAQWGLILGGYFGFKALKALARQNPDLAPWIWPVLGAYVVFVFLTWTAEPLSNLLLRLSPYGRLALSREQIVASNWLGAVLLVAIAALGWWLVTRDDGALGAAAGALFLTIPLSATFSCQPGWPRVTAAVYTGALACAGLGAIVLWATGPAGEAAKAAAGILGIVFIIGVLLGPWIANALLAVKPRR